MCLFLTVHVKTSCNKCINKVDYSIYEEKCLLSITTVVTSLDKLECDVLNLQLKRSFYFSYDF
jgi:hypothetical protein